MFIRKANLHNFTDDNALSAYASDIPSLINILEEESSNAVDWLNSNNMITNPEKFHALLLTKNMVNTAGSKLCVQNKEIYSENWITLLGIKIDSRVTFDQHISEICRKVSAQLNALIRLKSNLTCQSRKVLVQSYIYANFNYCPLVWHCSSAKTLTKIEKIQERALRFVYDNYTDSYGQLLSEYGKYSMEVRRLRNLCE
jgi:hypothetical protein